MRGTLLMTVLLHGMSAVSQSCLRVVDKATGAPIQSAVASCSDGTPAGLADPGGLLCLRSVCDTLVIHAETYRSVRIARSAALASGAVRLSVEAEELPPARIVPWPGPDHRHAMAALDAVDSTRLLGFERSSLRSSALLTPGVQWDQRGHGGSQRLSIRGSLLRSPFGVRGVKVYWGPFPLTLADGSSPLELLDPLLIGTLSVVRNVGDPAYGSAPSGLLLTTAPGSPAHGLASMVEGLGGPYGFFRTAALLRVAVGTHGLVAGAVRQRSDGYRRQEWSARDQVFIVGRFHHATGLTRVHITWQHASWALPGSLDSATAALSPREARPYSAALNAHVDKQQVIAGVAHERSLGHRMRLHTAAHGQVIDKLNPYGTAPTFCGHKDEGIQALGARFGLAGDAGGHRQRCTWEIGAEVLLERDDWKETTFVDARKGDLKVDALTEGINVNAFATTTTRLWRKASLGASVGAEHTRLDHDDRLLSRREGYRSGMRLLPCIGVEQGIGDAWRFHLRYTEAVSRPTIWELLGTTGRFNDGLRGEQVSEWQGGVALTPERAAVHGSAQVYSRRVDGLIQEAPIGTSDDRGFINAGRALIQGAEMQVIARTPSARSWRLHLLTSLALQRARIDLDTARVHHLPGSEPWRLVAVLQASHRSGTALEVGVRRHGPVRAAFTGPSVVPGATLVHLRLSAQVRIGGQRAELFVHVENLLNVPSTSWVQVNDPGGRYFNPAPGRGLFAGARLFLVRT